MDGKARLVRGWMVIAAAKRLLSSYREQKIAFFFKKNTRLFAGLKIMRNFAPA